MIDTAKMNRLAALLAQPEREVTPVKPVDPRLLTPVTVVAQDRRPLGGQREDDYFAAMYEEPRW